MSKGERQRRITWKTKKYSEIFLLSKEEESWRAPENPKREDAIHGPRKGGL